MQKMLIVIFFMAAAIVVATLKTKRSSYVTGEKIADSHYDMNENPPLPSVMVNIVNEIRNVFKREHNALVEPVLTVWTRSMTADKIKHRSLRADYYNQVAKCKKSRDAREIIQNFNEFLSLLDSRIKERIDTIRNYFRKKNKRDIKDLGLHLAFSEEIGIFYTVEKREYERRLDKIVETLGTEDVEKIKNEYTEFQEWMTSVMDNTASMPPLRVQRRLDAFEKVTKRLGGLVIRVIKRSIIIDQFHNHDRVILNVRKAMKSIRDNGYPDNHVIQVKSLTKVLKYLTKNAGPKRSLLRNDHKQHEDFIINMTRFIEGIKKPNDSDGIRRIDSMLNPIFDQESLVPKLYLVRMVFFMVKSNYSVEIDALCFADSNQCTVKGLTTKPNAHTALKPGFGDPEFVGHREILERVNVTIKNLDDIVNERA